MNSSKQCFSDLGDDENPLKMFMKTAGSDLGGLGWGLGLGCLNKLPTGQWSGKFGKQHPKIIYVHQRNQAVWWDLYGPLLNAKPVIWSCFKGTQQRLFKNPFIKQLILPRTQRVSSWRNSIKHGVTSEADIPDAPSIHAHLGPSQRWVWCTVRAILWQQLPTTHGRDPESALLWGWTSGPAVPMQEENLETEEKYT